MGLCAFFVRPFLSQGENNSFFFFCLDLGFIFTSVQLRGCSFILRIHRFFRIIFIVTRKDLWQFYCFEGNSKKFLSFLKFFVSSNSKNLSGILFVKILPGTFETFSLICLVYVKRWRFLHCSLMTTGVSPIVQCFRFVNIDTILHSFLLSVVSFKSAFELIGLSTFTGLWKTNSLLL